MIDFLIVGRGLAATSLVHTFYKHHVSFKVIGNETLSTCSKVAAGIWNPVVFKRLTKSWLADALIPCLNEFYANCETRLSQKLITQRPIIKPFTEEQEKTLWLKKAKAELEDFLDDEIKSPDKTQFTNFNIPNSYGTIKNCGNLDVAKFLEASAFFFKENFMNEIFDHNLLQVFPDKIRYQNTEARNIIFCEGYLVKNNPFFSWIPLKPAKGETLTIKADLPELKNSIFNKNGFLMDLSPGTYKVGATYAWDDLSQEPTEKGLTELKSKVEQMISCDYSILKQEAGIRPSSLDRRPIIGAHPLHKHVFVFNGLGTKGVMLAPFFSENFVNFYLQKESIHKEVDAKRFYHLYDRKI